MAPLSDAALFHLQARAGVPPPQVVSALPDDSAIAAAGEEEERPEGDEETSDAPPQSPLRPTISLADIQFLLAKTADVLLLWDAIVLFSS